MEASQQPTPEQAAAVGAAAGEAAVGEPTPEAAQAAAAEATRRKADEVKLQLTDDDVERLAAGVVEHLQMAGAFDQPLEPVQPPPPAPAPEESPAPPAPESVTPPAPPAPEAPPRKRSIAQRFLGE